MKLTNFLRLDLKTINPYFGIKQALHLSVFTLILSICFEFILKIHIPFLTFLIFGMVTLMMCSFPFALEEKNDINTFYVTQNIPRKTVVYGRFLFGLFVSFVSVIVGMCIDISVLIATGNIGEIKSEIIVGTVILLGLQVLNALRYPFFFKFGYAKGSIAASILPIAIIIAGVLLAAFANPNGFTLPTSVNVLPSVIALVPVIIMTYISAMLSEKFYQTREF
jgi:hypothetical protein